MATAKTIFNHACILLFAAGIIGMLIPARDTSPHELRWMAEISIAGHMMVFFLGAYLVYTYVPGFSARSLPGQILLLAAAALAASILIEGLQSLIPGRYASMDDGLANIAGAMAFVSVKNRRNIVKPFLLHIATAALAAMLLWPFFRAAADDLIACTQFPLLADFETPFEASRFIRGTGRFSVSDEHAFSGGRSLRATFGTQPYSGIALEYMPRNWRGYDHLHFAVYNPQKMPITLHLRIHDIPHAKSGRMIYADRFNRTYSLAPGEWNVIVIPLSAIKNAPQTRRMNMGKITNMGFFVAHEPSPVTLFIDDIRLK